jgi:hypothetical protein
MPADGRAQPEWPPQRRTRRARLVRSVTARGRREVQAATGVEKSRGIVAPARLVEVHGQEKACFVEEQRIHTGDKGLALGGAAGQVPSDDVVCDREKPAIGTFGTLDARLFADAAHSLAHAGA